MDRIGIFTEEQEELLATALDNLLKLDNPFLEAFDKPLFKIILRAGDDKGLDKLPEDWKLALIPIVDAALVADYETVREQATILLNKKVDLPSLGEEDEAIIFDSLTKICTTAIVVYVKKLKEN